MKKYKIAVVLTVEAKSYDAACEAASNYVDIAKKQLGARFIVPKAEFDYERDNDGQRVLYLPNEEE
jgi:hypothetical protein